MSQVERVALYTLANIKEYICALYVLVLCVDTHTSIGGTPVNVSEHCKTLVLACEIMQK